MNVMVPLPQEFAARFGSEEELRQHVLEVLAVDKYRAGRLSRPELRDVLGLRAGTALDGLLKRHGVQEPTTPEQLECDLQQIRQRLQSEQPAVRAIAADDLVEHFRAFRADKTLGGFDVKDLIAEGRR